MRKVKAKSYEYMENLLGEESPAKLLARSNSEKLGLEGISLSAAEAGMLRFFADQIQARKIVEIGTLTGLSALYLLENNSPDVCLWTLEKSVQHAELAGQVLQPYIDKNSCHILIGDAREQLQKLSEAAPFDIVFIDGNKAAYLDYFNWAVSHTRIGGMIIADNVFLAGAVWDDNNEQKFNPKQIKAVQSMNESAFHNPELQSMIIPTKEGLLICKKLS